MEPGTAAVSTEVQHASLQRPEQLRLDYGEGRENGRKRNPDPRAEQRSKDFADSFSPPENGDWIKLWTAPAAAP